MSTLGQKLKAKQDLKKIIQTIVDDTISEERSKELNELFSVFNENFVLKKDSEGYYDVAKAKHFFDICSERTKKEYSAKFMQSMAITQMLKEE